jgi:hypothetical protein
MAISLVRVPGLRPPFISLSLQSRCLITAGWAAFAFLVSTVRRILDTQTTILTAGTWPTGTRSGSDYLRGLLQRIGRLPFWSAVLVGAGVWRSGDRRLGCVDLRA